ncbi:hypothetical protein PTH_1886 [Pelotomaculum thermopropionicum SI]|uniref:Uncharacterized protein n=1 Tax=Pelotomaculum thermopropionicum (strain DSM 13744 / JCM 10971 / SI) TaxID=370438 RepID=A5D130_PELTS|nr:hypothetical protein PTH_1886 [Pelotomaculum thermopropionicum SI]
MAELADAQDLKSWGERSPYRFKSGLGHQPPENGGFFILKMINLRKKKDKKVFVEFSLIR